MRWKAMFFLKEQDDKYKYILKDVEFYEKVTYGFKTHRKPPPIKQMEFFEKECYEIIRNIEFREREENYGKFQKELKKDLATLNKLNKANKVVIPTIFTCVIQKPTKY